MSGDTHPAKEEEFLRLKEILTKALNDNLKILAMIEEILETPNQDDKTHLDLLINRIKGESLDEV